MGAGLGLGLAIWHATHQDEAGKDASAKNAGKATSTKSSTRSRERTTTNHDGLAVLKAIAPYIFEERKGDQPSRTQNFTYGDYLKQSSVQLIKAADKLAPADDVAATAISLLEKQAARMNGTAMTPEEAKEISQLQPRLLHWMRQDPETAIKYLFDGNRNTSIDLGSPLFAAISEKGLDTALGWMKGRDPRNSGQFSYIFSTYIGAQGDPASITKVKESLPPEHWKRVQGQIFSNWPFEKADELITIARENDSPGSLANLAMRHGQKGADWLMKHLESPDMDPALKEALINSQDYRQLLQNSSYIPIETRVEVLAKGRTDGKDAEQLTLELGGRDVSTALDNSNKDWRFAFRNGKASFEDVYAAVVADLPDLAKTSPDAIRLQIFKELAEENGPAAMEALANTPDADKWTLALKPTQWMFYNVDPQKFYDYLQAIPYQDPEHHQARFHSWVSHSQSNLALYSRDYVDWVKDMPPGIDRDMAAIGILRSIGSDNKTLIAEVDAWVKDPALRERIKAPPPK